MSRRPLAATIAAAATLVGSVAFASSSGAAVDQDLAVSAAAGPPGTVIEVSSASCVDEGATGTARLLQARLVAGVAPEAMAGAGTAFDGAPVKLTVPDWVDADADAVIEATCYEFLDTREGGELTAVPYTPVPFDVEPGVGAPVQTRSLSRTALKAGQAYQDTFAGCTLPGASYLASELYQGPDLTGRNLGTFAAASDGDITDGSLDVVLSNGSYSADFSHEDGQPVQIAGVTETPTDIPAGTYASYGYCGNDDGDLLFYEPTTIEVTGDAPFAAFDLTQPDPYTRTVVVEGQGCTAGTVEAAVFQTSLAEIQAEFSGTDDSGLQAAPKPDAALASGTEMASLLGERAGVAESEATEPGVAARSNAQLTDPAGTSVGGGQRATLASGQLTPDANGEWAARSDLDFDEGLVEGVAICGDPLAAGFYYDPQILVVNVSPAPVVPPTTAPPVQRVTNPAPANAVNGSPTYTG